MAAALVSSDQAYNRVCANLAHARLAIGGDSHAREVARALVGRISEGGIRLADSYDFSRGGMTLQRYRQSDLFHDLKHCSAQVVILNLGGNDFDMRDITRAREVVVKDICHLIKELTDDCEKVVYFLCIPTRFSRRNHELDVIQSNIKYVNTKMRQIMNGRYIDLTGDCFRENNFAERHGERVHLLPHLYRDVAEKLLRRVDRDLGSNLTPPGRFMEKVNRRIRFGPSHLNV